MKSFLKLTGAGALRHLINEVADDRYFTVSTQPHSDFGPIILVWWRNTMMPGPDVFPAQTPLGRWRFPLNNTPHGKNWSQSFTVPSGLLGLHKNLVKCFFTRFREECLSNSCIQKRVRIVMNYFIIFLHLRLGLKGKSLAKRVIGGPGSGAPGLTRGERSEPQRMKGRL